MYNVASVQMLGRKFSRETSFLMFTCHFVSTKAGFFDTCKIVFTLIWLHLAVIVSVLEIVANCAAKLRVNVFVYTSPKRSLLCISMRPYND